jgi:hypothetical protein
MPNAQASPKITANTYLDTPPAARSNLCTLALGDLYSALEKQSFPTFPLIIYNLVEQSDPHQLLLIPPAAHQGVTEMLGVWGPEEEERGERVWEWRGECDL